MMHGQKNIKFCKELLFDLWALHALKRQEAKFMWAPPQQETFEQLNLTLPTAPFWQVLDFCEEFFCGPWL